jgi:hypothetical protein
MGDPLGGVGTIIVGAHVIAAARSSLAGEGSMSCDASVKKAGAEDVSDEAHAHARASRTPSHS